MPSDTPVPCRLDHLNRLPPSPLARGPRLLHLPFLLLLHECSHAVSQRHYLSLSFGHCHVLLHAVMPAREHVSPPYQHPPTHIGRGTRKRRGSRGETNIARLTSVTSVAPISRAYFSAPSLAGPLTKKGALSNSACASAERIYSQRTVYVCMCVVCNQHRRAAHRRRATRCTMGKIRYT